MTKQSEERGRGEAEAAGASSAIAEVFQEAARAAIPAAGEEQALVEDLQRELRGFVRTFDSHPEWVWSPATVRFVQAVRPKLELLGGPIGPADAGREYGAAAASTRRDESGGPEAA